MGVGFDLEGGVAIRYSSWRMLRAWSRTGWRSVVAPVIRCTVARPFRRCQVSVPVFRIGSGTCATLGTWVRRQRRCCGGADRRGWRKRRVLWPGRA